MKIAFFVSRFPYPLEKGDKLRAYHFIKQLSRQHEVILFAVTDRKISKSDLDAMKPFCSSIHFHYRNKLAIVFSLLKNIFSSKPFSIAYFFSPDANKKWTQIMERENPDVIFSQLIRTAEYTRKYAKPRMLDYMDCFSRGMYQQMQTAPFILKPLYHSEYERLRKYEKDCLPDFSIHTIISEQDGKSFSFDEIVDFQLLPNGVDADYFVSSQMQRSFDLLFTGNMSYPPNVNAVNFLVKKILPIVWRTRPQTNLLIAGAQPSVEVRGLQNDKVTVSGWVNDIRDSYSSSRLFIAPMQIGIGMQNKVLEAMAMKVPCIVSSMVNQAIHAEVGKEICTANTPEEFAEAIIKLLADSTEANTLAENGRRFVLKNHNWNSIGNELNRLISAF